MCVLHSVSSTFTRRRELEHRQRTSPSTVLGAMAGRRIRVRACLPASGPGRAEEGFYRSKTGRDRTPKRPRAAEAQPKHRESMSRVEIAEEHAIAVEILDGLLHPYEEFNGKMAYPLFTEDYYRDAEGCKGQWRRQRDWHAQWQKNTFVPRSVHGTRPARPTAAMSDSSKSATIMNENQATIPGDPKISSNCRARLRISVRALMGLVLVIGVGLGWGH